MISSFVNSSKSFTKSFRFTDYFIVIKVILFISILTYLIFKIQEMEQSFLIQFEYIKTNLFTAQSYYLCMSIVLCTCNWYFEARKWEVAARDYTSINTINSLKGVLTGQALNLIFPASVGHIAGRVINSKGDSLNLSSRVVICQVSQMVVTFLMAIIGSFYFGNTILNTNTLTLLSVTITCSISLALMIYFIRNQPFIRKYLDQIFNIKRELLIKIFAFAFFRYLIFTFQYILILFFMGVLLKWYDLFFILSLVFCVKSLLPTFHFLSDLGIREFSALLFLPLLGIPSEIAIASSLLIWVINILLPSILGGFLLLNIKWN